MLYVISVGMSFALFTAIFFLTKKTRKTADCIAAAFMLFAIMPMGAKLFLLGLHFIPVPVIPFLRSAAFTFGPFLFLYAVAETGGSLRRWYLHFIPYGISILSVFFIPDTMFGPPPCCVPGHCIHVHSLPFNQMNFWQIAAGYVFPSLLVLSMGVYTLLIGRLLSRHRARVKDYYSSKSLHNTLRWLKWTVYAFFLSYGFVLCVDFLPSWIVADRLFDKMAAPDIATTFFIIVFSYFAVKQPVVFASSEEETGSGSELQAEPEGLNESERYSRSGLKDAEADAYCIRLEEYMKSQKPFLDPDLTIVVLSEKLDIPRHHITQVLNARIGKNFYSWVNEYRINEVLKAMAEEKCDDYSIIRIAYDAGFNSKSTFNTIFKKIVGLTPSEYRQKQIREQASGPDHHDGSSASCH